MLNKRIVLPAILALLALSTGTAYAEPKNGFGLNAGLASHSMTSPFGGYQSGGLSLGIDYQIALSDNLSLNPFLMSSAESTSGNVVAGTTAGHGILGLQLRYWVNDVFFGGHLGHYAEVLSTTNGMSPRARRPTVADWGWSPAGRILLAGYSSLDNWIRPT